MFQWTCTDCLRRKRFSKLQFAQKGDFKFELFPLHSPLLGESLLVSFPPLIDMLKFSGSSYLIWDHGSSDGSSLLRFMDCSSLLKTRHPRRPSKKERIEIHSHTFRYTFGCFKHLSNWTSYRFKGTLGRDSLNSSHLTPFLSRYST